jgi:DhnA family fructose-bisphosphate aldolase class Ia
MEGKQIRLSHLFPDGGTAVVVAIDHGQTFGPAEGLVHFAQAAENLKGANGVLLAAHMIRHSGNLFTSAGSPVVITRLNWNTIHCEPWDYQEANIVRTLSVHDAIKAGAEIVLASLTLLNTEEKIDARNVETFSRSVEEAYDLGIPLIGEVFPAGDLRSRPAEFHDYIKKSCRIIAELGADAIKTFYTGERFPEVVEGTPVPIFALGAEKLESELDALKLAEKAVHAGAKGVVFGRNVIQAANPGLFLKALKSVVQNQVSPQDALGEYGGTR